MLTFEVAVNDSWSKASGRIHATSRDIPLKYQEPIAMNFMIPRTNKFYVSQRNTKIRLHAQKTLKGVSRINAESLDLLSNLAYHQT